jgi:prefoldin subunit 5
MSTADNDDKLQRSSEKVERRCLLEQIENLEKLRRTMNASIEALNNENDQLRAIIAASQSSKFAFLYIQLMQ